MALQSDNDPAQRKRVFQMQLLIAGLALAGFAWLCYGWLTG